MKTRTKNFLHYLALALWIGFIVIAAQLLVALIVTFFVGKSASNPIWTTIIIAISFSLALFLTIKLPTKLNRKLQTDREELGLANLPTWTDLGLAPIGLIASLVVSTAISALFSLFSWYNATQAQNVGFSNLGSSADKIAAFFALVVVAPIVEEILFRGWLYGKLRNHLSFLPAALLVSLLFGILHGQLNVGITVCVMSLIMCGLREITGTVYSGIFLHMLKNALGFYFLFFMIQSF